MSIQTSFNSSLQGTNNIYGNILSNDDASFNNVNCNTLNATNQNVNNTTLNNTTLNGTTNLNGNIIANSQTITPLNLSTLDTTTSLTNQLNNKQATINTSTNLSINNLTTNGTSMIAYVLKMFQPQTIVLTPTINDVISWVSGQVNYWANGTNIRSDTSTQIQHKVSTQFQNLSSSYQTKALLSSSGIISNYPTWTTLPSQTNTSGTLTFNLCDGTTFPYLDNTNYKFHRIYFQGYIGGGTFTNKPALSLYLMVNNTPLTSSSNYLENCILRTNRPTSAITGLDTTASTRDYVVIMTNMENNGNYDFNGNILIPVPYGDYREFKVDCSYLHTSVGATNSFGSFRLVANSSNPNINGIQLQFTNMATNSQIINLRFYVESF